MHATVFLNSPEEHEVGPIVVLPGEERSLKQAVIQVVSKIVLGDQDHDASLTYFTGKTCDLTSVRDELWMVSMWSDKRLVIVEQANDFVSQNRGGLEKLLEKPAKKSVLVLDVNTWPKNTRLAKKAAKIGLVVECTELSGSHLTRWLQETCRQQHEKQLTRDAAELLTELAGNHLGLLEQELAKLAAYVGDHKRIVADDIRAMVGGWKAETTWVMTNAVRDGQLGLALDCLEKLLVAGEAPQKILGGISFVFRKLARATEIARQGTQLNAALREARVFPKDVAPSANYLRRIGRPNAEKLYHWLLDADGNLKTGSRISERVQLEQLLVQLSGKI